MFSTLRKAAFVEKLEEKIHLWRPFFSSMALSRRTFSARGGGGGGAFAPIAPPPAYAPGQSRGRPVGYNNY